MSRNVLSLAMIIRECDRCFDKSRIWKILLLVTYVTYFVYDRYI